MNRKIKKVAYAGYVAKGAVYGITGVLAFLVAFNMGGEKAGKLRIIDFLEKQPFGNLLLATLGLGLLCYAFWRFVQSIQDPEKIGSDAKGMVKRISFFISGLIYAALGVFAILDIFYDPSSSSNGNSGSFLSGNMAKYIFIIIGVALAVKGFYQFIKAYKGDFLKKFRIPSLSSGFKRKFVKKMGYAGLIARGILTGIIAYFFLKAGTELHTEGTQEMKGTAEAFSFIQQNSSGPWLLGLVAGGLVCYGIYMFMMAAYRQFDD